MKQVAVMSKPSFALILMHAIAPPWSSSAAGAAAPDRAVVRQALEQMWESLATLEFQEEGLACDSRYRPDRSRGSSRRTYAFGPGGRRASQTWTVEADGQTEWLGSDMRRDGKNRYLISHSRDDPDVIERVMVVSDYETHEDSPTVPVHTMNYLTPFGKPLHRYLDDPATTLEVARDDEGRELVALVTEVRGLPVRIELDPGRDWLAHRYTMGDAFESHVLRFEQENGRWFPVESVTSKTGREGSNYSKYIVTGLKINHPIPEERFRPPPLPDGVVVLDGTGTRKEARVVGGAQALRKRHEEPRPTSDGSPPQPASSIPLASVDPERFPWSLALGAAGLIALVTALTVRLRRS